MVCNVITADKANRLFWLGRYAERVYLSLHLLRRYYDRALDGDSSALEEYYRYLGMECGVCGKPSCEEFHLAQLYDRENVCSIATSIDLTNDNSIVLRDDIKSESLSYIQLSKVLLEECAARNEDNITNLQLITDYMLAFFGSIDERVFDKRIRKLLKAGKLVENLDLHIRFEYPFFRIEQAYIKLKDTLEKVGADIDSYALEQLDQLIDESRYAVSDSAYKERVLGYLNSLVLV